MYIPRPTKLLFQHDDGWSKYLNKHGDTLSDWTKLAVERMLACGTCLMGVRRYCCASQHCGGAVVHHYLDHHTGKHRRQTLSQEDMIGRYISHVPARHFKMVHYSGFLANRKRGTLLPRVYEALQMQAREKPESLHLSIYKVDDIIESSTNQLS
jgi:hypothetical protein